MAFSIDIISPIVFYIIIFSYLIYRRQSINVQKFGKIPVAFLLRTKRSVSTIRKIGQKYQKFWKYFGYAAIPTGFIGLIGALSFLIFELARIITTPEPISGIGIVLPGIRIPGSPIFVPFWYGIIALFIVLVVHEGAHGLVAESWGLKLKSAGVGMFLMFPFAFVEPDEKKLQKAAIKTQMSVFAAGPFANITLALLAFLIGIFILAPAAAQVLDPAGVYIDSVDSGFPAEAAGLQPGVTVTKIDNQEIIEVSQLLNHMASLEPGDKLTMYSEDDSFEVTTTQSPTNASKAHLGIRFKQNTEVKPSLQEIYGNLPLLLVYTTTLFYWIFMLNIGIGIVNLLPLGPIDGGRMIDLALKTRLKNKKLASKLYSIITTISLSLLALNFLMPYFINNI